MRIVAALLTLAGLAACAWAGLLLWQEIETPPAAPQPAEIAAASAEAEAQPPRPPRRWVPLYGEPAPPAPPAPPEPEPQPPAPPPEPAPPMPPLDSLGYSLKGLVRAGESAVWALVSHPTGERVLKAGDELEPGLTITRIEDEGIWVTNGAGSEALLAFDG